MTPSQDDKGGPAPSPEPRKSTKLGLVSGVYIPVCLNILSILMFLRFGYIIGQVGFVGILGLLLVAYSVDLLTALSLSAIASNGEVKGGGAYYLISRSLGPEFGGSIGILFFLAQVLNTAMNVVGLIDCIQLNVGPNFPHGYWVAYGIQSAALLLCTGMCFLGSATFSKASNALLVILTLSIVSIPLSAAFKAPFHDLEAGVEFTGLSFNTLAENFLPHTQSPTYRGAGTFRDLFGVLFPATSGIFAGAAMSGDLRSPSSAIPKGTLWAMLTTFIVYFIVVLAMAASTTHASFLANDNVIPVTSLLPPIILAGECAVSLFSALMGIIGSAKLFQALARDRLLPGLAVFGKGTKSDEPIVAIFLVYAIAQVAMLADLNQIATFISMGFQMTFFVMNLACFLLKIGSAPNFRPGFKFFTWQTALLGSLLSAGAMFFIEETYAAMAICALVLLFLLIHYLCPPKKWGDVSQNLIYHQVRKYLLRLKPEHIKFWRPHIILLINDPRRQTRLIQFCNSMKKGSLYILGHVIVTDDFNSGVHEARLQQQAWTNYISEFSRIKAFVQLTMSPTITWGIRNLILSAGLGGMRPNIAVLGFYNMDDLRRSGPPIRIPDIPCSPTTGMAGPPKHRSQGKTVRRRRGDTSARLLEGYLPTDVIRTEGMMSPAQYMTMLEDLALRYRLNVAVGYGFDKLETPSRDGGNTKRYVDLWPIQMSAEVSADGKNVLTTNFDTYTLILQLGHILRTVQTWKRAYQLRVMVFVEYENEVEEERARVKALLEKLRIDAEVFVFWLASGELNSYELIINGLSNDIDWDIIVNEALKEEEWWDELQMFRGRMEDLSSSQEMSQLVQLMDSVAGRPGQYNPHDENELSRQQSGVADIPELPRKPDINILAKLGVSVGMHTQHLNQDVLDELSSDDEVFLDAEEFDTEEEGGTFHGNERILSEMETLTPDPVKEPLLSSFQSQRSQRHSRGESEGSSTMMARRNRAPRTPVERSGQVASAYGTMSTSQTLAIPWESTRGTKKAAAGQVPLVVREGPSPSPSGDLQAEGQNIDIEPFPSLDPLETPQLFHSSLKRSRSMSPIRASSGAQTLQADGDAVPTRPTISRQSSAVRFSSRPMPETTVTTTEDEGPRLGFSQGKPGASETPKTEKPSFSRHSSYGKFSSRPTPETRVTGGEDGSRTITFADQPVHQSQSASHSRHHSRQGSSFSNFGQSVGGGGGEASVSIPELFESYRLNNGGGMTSNEADMTDGGGCGGSSYSTQAMALSFNDLPSRAQHLVLNELIRQKSGDTAVLMTTLPIPSEGTSLDEVATVQYLSDVEVLCNELPPTLMVLSNNMTVTVSL